MKNRLHTQIYLEIKDNQKEDISTIYLVFKIVGIPFKFEMNKHDIEILTEDFNELSENVNWIDYLDKADLRRLKVK